MQYHLIFSADQNYIPYLLVLCQSILDHIERKETNAQDELVFNVLTDDSVDLDCILSKAQCFIDSNQQCGIPFKFEWHIVDPKQFDGFILMFRGNKSSYSTYYRLIMDRFIPHDVERAVYLDIDMLVLDDIRKLFHENPLDNKVLGVIFDLGATNNKTDEELHNPYIHAYYKDNSEHVINIPKTKYFNAGVLLINLVEWRKQNIGQKCLELASKINVQYHDQDLLNIVCLDKVCFINVAWNFQFPMFFVLYNEKTGKYDIADAINNHVHWMCEIPSAEEFEKAAASPCIVHFNGTKPWVCSNVLEHGLKWKEGVPFTEKQRHYQNLWLNLSAKVLGKDRPHNVNADAISSDTLKLYNLNLKRRKDRKLLLSLVSVSLVLNVINLILLFFF